MCKECGPQLLRSLHVPLRPLPYRDLLLRWAHSIPVHAMHNTHAGHPGYGTTWGPGPPDPSFSVTCVCLSDSPVGSQSGSQVQLLWSGQVSIQWTHVNSGGLSFFHRWYFQPFGYFPRGLVTWAPSEERRPLPTESCSPMIGIGRSSSISQLGLAGFLLRDTKGEHKRLWILGHDLWISCRET